MKDKSIESLINKDIMYARVLEYLGVEFYDSRHKTLSEICEEYQMDINRLEHILTQSTSRRAPEYLELRNLSANLIVAYLKKAHQIFIKDTLPYILKKISELDDNQNAALVQELKMVLPMFIEDFIIHIHEEEDTLFKYVSALEDFVLNKKGLSFVQSKLDHFSIQEFALDHNDSDNEMKGIRGITNDYQTEQLNNPRLALIMTALRQFDEELTRHANIENDILFTKALRLEQQARQLIKTMIILN